MSDNDLIRRGDVREALRSVDAWNMANAQAIAALPAVTAPPEWNAAIRAAVLTLAKAGEIDAITFRQAAMRLKALLRPEECLAPAQPAPDACPCGSDVTDMDGHTVHDDDCPESWQSQATIRKSQTVAKAEGAVVKQSLTTGTAPAKPAPDAAQARIAAVPFVDTHGPLPDDSAADDDIRAGKLAQPALTSTPVDDSQTADPAVNEWNAAIEAAANIANGYGSEACDPDMYRAILALKRGGEA